MLTYDEFKQAIDRGYITGDTVMIVRKKWRSCDRGDSGRSDGGIRQIKKTFPSPKSDAPQRKITTLF